MKNRASFIPLALSVLSVLFCATGASAQDHQGSEEMMIVSSDVVTTQTVTSPDDGMSNDELMKGYIQRLFDESLGIKPAQARTIYVRDKLTGCNLKLYDKLKTVVTSIAAGTTASTVIDIPLGELSDKLSWKQSELTNTIIVGSSISQAAMKEAFTSLGIDLGSVNRALLADCPYELYWFDKTAGVGMSASYGASYSNGIVTLSGTVFITMYVSVNYSVGGNLLNSTTVNTDLVSSVNTAIANALNIATTCKNNSSTSLACLTAFKTRICSLVSYNEAATAKGVHYGDPWQLVWVFDGDKSTNVVCEGYAKAFKYLCDLADLEDVDCMIATGTMSGGTGAGGHMWNVVRMDDGECYLVDVTNSDAGSIGQDGGLFMAYGPSGSYASGYTFTPASTDILFEYDDQTKANFGESLLTIANTAYKTPTTLNMNENIATQLSSLVGQEANIKFERTGLTASKPITVCLPYNYDVSNCNGQFYTFTGVEENAGVWEATMTLFEGSMLIANTPYLFVPSGTSSNFGGKVTVATTVAAGQTTSTDSKWAFHGAYAKKTWDALGNDYGFAATSGKALDGVTDITAGQFVRVGNGAWMNPMSAYLTYQGASSARGMTSSSFLPSSISVKLVKGDGETTAIAEVEQQTQGDAVYYDLQGRRVSAAAGAGKGVYINREGKKMIIR